MTRNLSDSCWSSDDSSFGWVDMEDKESVGAKTVERRPSGSEDDSSDDSDTTQFDPECVRPVVKAEPKQKQKLTRNGAVSANISRGQVKNGASEDSDSTQFDAELDSRPVVKDTVRSKGNKPLTVKGGQLKTPRTKIPSKHETSRNSTSGKSSSESSDDSSKKDLKPFTKRLLVKKERHSHALSDDSDIDSPPPKLRSRLSVKSESGTPQKKTKDDLRATLIEGVFPDTAQPLPFDIDANEDVWIVQCPNEVSESTLKGKTLNFNGVSCAEQFEGRVLLNSNPKPVTLLLPKSPLKLRSLTPVGHIIFKEKEMAPHTLHPVCIEDNITSLPAGLKERHPLFGADLSLVQKLSSQMQKRKKMMKRMKKKKQDVSDLGASFCEDENEVTEEKSSAKLSNDLDVSSVHNKKKKKKNKHLDEQIQLSSFHSGSSPKITSEKEINGFVVSDGIESELQQKRKKKVKLEAGEVVSPGITNVHPELAFVTPSKKKKHKHLEYSFESGSQSAGGTPDDPENILSQKRKKRKYENESNISYDVYSTSERTIEPSESFAESSHHLSMKKKKHHKYEIDYRSKNIESDEFPVCSQDTPLDPVTEELLHRIKKKKKKIKENDMESTITSNIGTNSDVNCISTKKKKKLKIENIDDLGHLSFNARDTKDSICDVTGADLDYFEVNRKKIPKKERRKLEGTFEFSEENSAHSKLKHSNSLLKQESSYDEHSPITDVHQKKKKKKRKSE